MIYTVTLNPSVDRTLHFEALTLGAVNRATATRTDWSGKGVNVSQALHSLGVPTVMTGFVAGAYGHVLVEKLKTQGYVCAFLEVQGETRSNITVIDLATGTATKLNEPGPTVTVEDIARFEAHLLGLVRPGDLCVFCGSLPAGAPPGTYARFIRALSAMGVPSVLDTSGTALKVGCDAGPWLIKPNALEAQELLGRPLEEGRWAEAALAMRASGPENVLLTLGAQGAIWAEDKALWWAEPPAIHEVSNIGAGDAALAGALYAWQAGLPPEEYARWAAATGTAKALCDGTQMPPRALVEEIYAQVRVRRPENV